MNARIPDNEAQRLAALGRYGIVDTPADDDFDEITRLASDICGTPISLISLVTKDRQWFKSRFGLDAPETHRDLAFCAHAILEPRDMLIVPNATEDPRFLANPLVTGDPNIRFYAGAPLVTGGGFALGTLCVIDQIPRDITPKQRRSLRALANQVVAQFELRIRVSEQEAMIEGQRQMELALRESESRFRLAIDSMHEGFVLQNDKAEIMVCNARAETILGLTRDQMAGRTSLDPRWRAVHEDGSPFPGETHPAIVTLRTGIGQQDVVMGIHKPGGELVWVSVNAVPLFYPGKEDPYSVVVTFADITKRRWLESQMSLQMEQTKETNIRLEAQQAELAAANLRLESLAKTDGLTGIFNHRSFHEKLVSEYDRSNRHQTPLSMLLMDVDSFKAFNDTFGHPAGDGVLRNVAGILQSTARHTDLVARYGGEEFAVILVDTDETLARVAAERFRSAIEEFVWEDRAITVSIGVTTLASTTEDIHSLIEDADQAMYRSKRAGRNCVTHSSDPCVE